MKTETKDKYLKYEFTEAELVKFRSDLVGKTNELAQKEAKKGAINKQFSSEISRLTGETRSLASKISARHEYREIPCTVRYDYVQIGTPKAKAPAQSAEA